MPSDPPASLAPLLLELRERNVRLRQPPPGYDVRDASDERLWSWGLPSRPDPVLNPALAALWGRMLLEPNAVVPTTLVPRLEARPAFLMRAAAETLPTGGGRAGTSSNWSGALIAAHSAMRFHYVAGAWRIPTPAKPPGAGATTPGQSWRCSVWIGLDAHRAFSNSLPQIGTTSAIAEDGSITTYAWAQWWVRGKLHGEVEFQGFDVAPGEEVMATLEVQGPSQVLMTLVNRSRQTIAGGATWRAGTVAGVNSALGDRSEAPVEGHSAQWIVERPLTLPTANPPNTLFALPDYDAVVFTECAAQMRKPGATPVARDLRSARLLRMHDVLEQPWRSRLISVPAVAGAGAALRMDKQPEAVRYRYKA